MDLDKDLFLALGKKLDECEANKQIEYFCLEFLENKTKKKSKSMMGPIVPVKYHIFHYLFSLGKG